MNLIFEFRNIAGGPRCTDGGRDRDTIGVPGVTTRCLPGPCERTFSETRLRNRGVITRRRSMDESSVGGKSKGVLPKETG